MGNAFRGLVTLILVLCLACKPSTAQKNVGHEAAAAAAAPLNQSDLVGDFYQHACPQYAGIIMNGVSKSLISQRRNAASLLRLFFHDCFVNGCDASVLLDDTTHFRGEKTAGPNNRSIRGFDVIDKIKEELERQCPEVVSCADLLAVIARDAVYLSGGPYWDVTLGRRDSLTASFEGANKYIPNPDFSFDQLVGSFAAVGLSAEDLAALTGAHTIGFARCTSLTNRLYNASFMARDAPMPKDFRKHLELECPRGGNPDALQPLDSGTDYQFDNSYYRDLKQHIGLLHSDEALYTTSTVAIRKLLDSYAADYNLWSNHFTTSIIKMGSIRPLLHPYGEIRKNCRRINP